MITFYKSSLISLFTKVQQLNAAPKNACLCLEIQEALLRRITYIERRIRTLKSQINFDRKRLRSHDMRLSKAESGNVKNQISHAIELIDQYQNLLIIFRDIGDAIAFTYIDKWDIKPMAFKESAGFISGKRGSRLERRILRGGFSLGATIILNDLTNCLRHADLTIPRGNEFMLIEVKSGRKRKLDQRGERQLFEANKITTYLGSDKAENLYKHEGTFVRVAAHTKERNHIDNMNRVLLRAMGSGTCMERVENGLYYYAANRFDLESLTNVGKSCDEHPIVACLNFMDDTAYYPLTLSIRNPKALYEFYAGRLYIFVFISPTVIKQICSDEGFSVELLLDDHFAMKLTHPKLIELDEHSFRVGRHIFGRIFGEFLSLKWFLTEMMKRGSLPLHETFPEIPLAPTS